MNIKLIFRPGSLWIGAHWSAQNRQWCVNLIPCVTLRIRLEPRSVIQVAVRTNGPLPGEVWKCEDGRKYTVKGIRWDVYNRKNITVEYDSTNAPGYRFTTTLDMWRRRFSRVS